MIGGNVPVPKALEGRLVLPVIAAPLFLVSGPELVIAACNSGVLGSFPSLNVRTTGEFEAWLERIRSGLSAGAAPYGVNLVAHSSNKRLDADVAVVEKHKVPVVITSVGNPRDIATTVHGYGGLVFHDATTIEYAQKAIKGGVDGVILVCAGSGGHSGNMNPFALVPQVREFYDGTIILAGCVSDGRSIRAAQVLGADMVYMGTRFVASAESMASSPYKDMLMVSEARDLIPTKAFSGITASMLRPSIVANGLDPDNLKEKDSIDFIGDFTHEAKAWRDIWSAGQGVGSIHDVPPVRDIVARLKREYDAAA
jgi:nitronate monooxygenase